MTTLVSSAASCRAVRRPSKGARARWVRSPWTDRRSLLDGGARAATVASSLNDGALTAAATDAGFEVTTTADGLRIAAPVVEVGRLAADQQIVLTKLNSEAAALEERFLQLTASTQRGDGTTTPGAPR